MKWGYSDLHRHRASIRYMIKMLLRQIYIDWRTFENLPVREPYEVEYLKRQHHGTYSSQAKTKEKAVPVIDEVKLAELRLEEEARLAG